MNDIVGPLRNAPRITSHIVTVFAGIPSAGYLNIRGVYLHVMADALGSVVVIVSALIIWQTNWALKYVFEAAIPAA